MERDFFKQYIQEHKDAFEDEALPPNMLGNILSNTRERGERKAQKKRKITYTWLAVACSLFMVTGAYLFLSREAEEIKNPTPQVATVNENSTTQPVTENTIELPMVKETANTSIKQLAAHRPKANPYQEIYDGLVDSLSVASRLDAIIKVGTLALLNEKLKTDLCRTFNEDGNDNVRLAALEVLSKFANDSYVHEQLMAGLSKQKDPVVQLELIKIMGNNGNPETTDKLIEMANNPFTVNAVKEQVYYALLTNNN